MLSSATLAWLIDQAFEIDGADRFLAEFAARLTVENAPIAGAALTLAVADPLVARRAWLWRADRGEVIEALAFAPAVGPAEPAGSLNPEARSWLARIAPGPVEEFIVGAGAGAPRLAFAGARAFLAAETEFLRLAARHAAAPLAALAARATLAATLEAYLGRRSAAAALAAPLRRTVGETIEAALLFADLRDFTAMSESEPPAEVIAALDAWFDRIAGAVHAFGGEVLKFIGDGVLAIFPVEGSPKSACAAAVQAVVAARAGMARLNAERQGPALQFGAALHLGRMLWGNIGAANRLDFTAIGPAVNLVSRLEGLCKPLGQSALVSGALAAEVDVTLAPLGRHALRGIVAPCEVFALP